MARMGTIFKPKGKKSQSSNFMKEKIRDAKKRERTIDRYETS